MWDILIQILVISLLLYGVELLFQKPTLAGFQWIYSWSTTAKSLTDHMVPIWVNLQIVHKVKPPYGIMSFEKNVHTKYIGSENVHMCKKVHNIG